MSEYFHGLPYREIAELTLFTDCAVAILRDQNNYCFFDQLDTHVTAIGRQVEAHVVRIKRFNDIPAQGFVFVSIIDKDQSSPDQVIHVRVVRCFNNTFNQNRCIHNNRVTTEFTVFTEDFRAILQLYGQV